MEDIDIIIKELIADNIGDIGRLEEMLERYQRGKPLYNSDMAYLDKYYTPPIDDDPVTFSGETFIFEEIPKIKNKRTSVIVLKIILIVIAVAAAILLSLIVFTNLIYFHGIPQEGFCYTSPGPLCIEKPYFQDFLQLHFEHIYDRIVMISNRQ